MNDFHKLEGAQEVSLSTFPLIDFADSRFIEPEGKLCIMVA
ncbi:hypothetical protein MY9_0652 [Bacillus sp. JS]|nr:hypothetical protein MY9_0652 [Bacillus sp. JS]